MLRKLIMLTITTIFITVMGSVNAETKTKEIKTQPISVITTDANTEEGFVELTSTEMDTITASGWPKWLRWLRGNGTNRNGIIKGRRSTNACWKGSGC